MSAVVELRGIGKAYGRRTALEALDLRVQPGEVVGLLGPNGAGKTTAVKVLLGLVRPTSGEGRLFDQPLGDPEARRRVGYLPEMFRNPPWLTAREVLGYHAELLGLPAAQRKAAVEAALANADLADRADDLVGRYSKGMQQRVGLAVALLGGPAFVVLDEPATGLDPIGREELRGAIRGLRESGTSVLLNSHQLSEVEQVCDRVTILHQGRVLADGRMDELLRSGGIRVRAMGLDQPLPRRLDAFGPVEVDGITLLFRGLEETRVPELVATLVELGAQVHAVEPIQPTLEERFRQLLHVPPEGHA
jgi:ABC-2 type transport system ATP-binding protein